MARPTPAHALAEIEAVAKGLADLREAAGAAETEQDAASLKFAASELQHRIAALHLDKLGDDIDDPAWHDVHEALAALCTDLGIDDAAPESEPEAKALSNEDVAKIVAARYGAGTRKPDLADYIVNGFEEGLRMTARAAWAGVKLAVAGAVAAGKLAAPVIVAAGEAAGRAGQRAAEAIARAWDESQHPRDESGKFTRKEAAMNAFADATDQSLRRLMKRAVRAWKRAGDGDLETLIAMMQALIEQTRAAREELAGLAAADAELTPDDAALLDMLAALTVETRARADELAQLAAASGAKSRSPREPQSRTDRKSATLSPADVVARIAAQYAALETTYHRLEDEAVAAGTQPYDTMDNPAREALVAAVRKKLEELAGFDELQGNFDTACDEANEATQAAADAAMAEIEAVRERSSDLQTELTDRYWWLDEIADEIDLYISGRFDDGSDMEEEKARHPAARRATALVAA